MIQGEDLACLNMLSTPSKSQQIPQNQSPQQKPRQNPSLRQAKYHGLYSHGPSLQKRQISPKFLSHQASLQLAITDPQAAVETIVGEAKQVGLTNLQIYTFFGTIRQKMLKTPSMENPGWKDQITDIMKSFYPDPTVSDVDKRKLMGLLKKPISKVHWATASHSFTKDPRIKSRMSEVKVMMPSFYEFVCPAEISAKAVTEKIARTVKSNEHDIYDKDYYNFTEADMDKMIEDSVNYINSNQDWTKPTNSSRLISGLCLLTGRRKWEIASTIQVRGVSESDYQVEIRGLCKTHLDDEWRRIPVLVPYSTIIKGIVQARMYTHKGRVGNEGGYHLFAKPLTHTMYRSLYSDRAHRDRHLSKFLVGSESCAPSLWKSKALGIDIYNYTHHYNVASVSQNDHHVSSPEPVVRGNDGQ